MGKEGEASAESMSTAPASRFPLGAQVLYIVVRLCFHEGEKKKNKSGNRHGKKYSQTTALNDQTVCADPDETDYSSTCGSDAFQGTNCVHIMFPIHL